MATKRGTGRMSTRTRARPVAPLVPVENTPTAPATQQAGIVQRFEDWLANVWAEVKTFALQIWDGVKGVCEFSRDLGQLVWTWLFHPDQFVAERTRFQLRYLAVNINTQELAASLAMALNTR